MKRGKFLAAILGIAGLGMLALGIGSTPASAQAYGVPACAAGYYYANGYCYPYRRLRRRSSTTRRPITHRRRSWLVRPSASALVSVAAGTAGAGMAEAGTTAAGTVAAITTKPEIDR